MRAYGFYRLCAHDATSGGTAERRQNRSLRLAQEKQYQLTLFGFETAYLRKLLSMQGDFSHPPIC